MARSRHVLGLAFKSWGVAKHTAPVVPALLEVEAGRGLQALPRSSASVLVSVSAGSSFPQQATSSDHDGRFCTTIPDACSAAVPQQGGPGPTFAVDGARSGRFGCEAQLQSIRDEVPGAVRFVLSWRSIHYSQAAAADECSRSREGGDDAQPGQRVDQKRGVPGTEGEAQLGQEAESRPAKEKSQVLGQEDNARFQGSHAPSASAPGLSLQGDEAWQGSSDSGALNNLAFLEEMLRELESTKRGHGAGAAEDDQFVASLRLRLAQEYAAHDIKMQEAESLAFKAWQFFKERGSKDDIAGAIALHVVGTCRARRGEMSSAYNIMKSVVAAARACRNAASASGRGQKKRGPKKGSRPGSPMQPHASVAQLLLQEQEAVAAPDAAEQHSDSRYVAQSLEFSCQMMMGEIRNQEGEHSEAATHYRAAVELVEKTRALHPASARREAYFQLVQALSQDQLYREALAFAQRCPLGESPEALTDPTLASAFDQPGEGEEGESRLAEAFDLIQEKRLLASIYMGLGDVERAVQMSKGVREVLEGVGAPPLDLAAADVATAELLLLGSEREESTVLEKEEEGEPAREELSVGTAQETGVGGPGEGRWGALQRLEGLQEEALDLLTRALRTQQSELGPSHPVLVATAVAAAEACVQLGKAQEAQEFAGQALGLLSSDGAPGPDSLEHAPELMGQLASIYLSLGQPKQGEVLLRRAEKLLLHDGRKGDALGMLVEYAADLIPHAEFHPALSLLLQIEQEYRDTLPKERGWHLELLHAKGCALSSEGHHEAALSSLEQAKSLLKGAEQAGELGEMAMRIHFSLAAAYYRASKLDGALVAQEELLSLLEEQGGKGDPLYLSELDKLHKLQAEMKSS